MSVKTRVVPGKLPHKIDGGGPVERKYDATYKFGNTTVHIVAPPPMSPEELQKRIREMYQAGWALWNSLPVEVRLRINSECQDGGSVGRG